MVSNDRNSIDAITKWVPSIVCENRIGKFLSYRIVPYVFKENISKPIEKEEDWIKRKIELVPFDRISEENIDVSLKIFKSMISNKVSEEQMQIIMQRTRDMLFDIKKVKEEKWEEYKKFQLSQLPF
jgi:hypothetical protein